MKTRYLYHTDEEKIYTLSELEKLYNELVASWDINTEEEPFNYYIDACTDKNGALTEIYGNLTVIYTDAEGNETSIIFDNYKDAFIVCDCLYNALNCYNAQVIDEKGQILK